MTTFGTASARCVTLRSQYPTIGILSVRGGQHLGVRLRSVSSTALGARRTRQTLLSSIAGRSQGRTTSEYPDAQQKQPLTSMSGPKYGHFLAVNQGAKADRPKKAPAALRPSASILLLSPTNQVLLLHRVGTSSSFASAHVFPGGNLSSFHEGTQDISADSPEIHRDSLAYRLAAIRETFEESGILLARKSGSQGLLHVPDDVREAGRKKIHGNEVRFTDWLKSVGGEPDVDNLIPFTRWITPPGPPKRFTTQMYLYMLPLSTAPPLPGGLQHRTAPQQAALVHAPTHDGGLEHTAATFDAPQAWLARARSNDIILFPPQFYLLHLVSSFLRRRPGDGHGEAEAEAETETAAEAETDTGRLQAQRDALLRFLNTVPPTVTSSSSSGHRKPHPTAAIPWRDKVMSPSVMFVRRADGRLVLGLDKPGKELQGTERGGDWDRVVLVNFRKEGPRDVEVRWREEVLQEEREMEAREEKKKEEGGAKL
ncbi:hypothetical protein VTK26DRAFT_3707 [Humicola hyalothermophila]